MTAVRTCPGHGCTRPLNDSEFLCRGCQRRAERILGDLPSLARAVEETIAKLDTGGNVSGGSRGVPESQPPANLAASDRARDKDAFGLLFEWADAVAADYGMKGLPIRLDRIPLSTVVPAAVAILLSRSEWFRRHPDGPDAASAIWHVQRNARRIVDRRPDRWYAGRCGAAHEHEAPCSCRCHVTSSNLAMCDVNAGYGTGCGPHDTTSWVCDRALYALPGRAEVTCDGWRQDWLGCGRVHLATERSAFILATLEDELVPLDLILAALPTLIHRNPDAATVRQWRHRQKIVPKSQTVLGVVLYRGGDVIKAALDTDARPGPRRRDTPVKRSA